MNRFALTASALRQPQALALVLLVAAGVAAPAARQTFTPIGEEYLDVSAVLQDIGAKSAVFKPADPDAKQLYYLPFFVLKAGPDGKLLVAVQPGKPGRKVITIWLLVSPQNKLEAIAAYVRAQERARPVDPRFADVSAAQLIGLTLSGLGVEEVSTEAGRIGFRFTPLPHPGAFAEVQLDADLPADEADAVAQELRDGKRLPQFTIKFEVAARQTLSKSRIEASARFFYEVDEAKKLAGARPVGESGGWKVGPAGAGFTQAAVNRDQRQTFEGRMRTKVAMLIQLEDPRDESYLRYMDTYFGRVFDRIDIEIKPDSKNPLSGELARLAVYDFDPNDLKPDELDHLFVDVKNFLNDERMERLHIKGSASARIGLMGGSASGELSKESLVKTLRDNGWKIEEQGKRYIPKSLTLWVVKRDVLNTEGALTIDIVRGLRQFTRLNARVGASVPYCPKSVGDTLVAFEVLRADVRELTAELSRERERGAGIEKALRDWVAAGMFGTPRTGLAVNTDHLAETDGIVIGTGFGQNNQRVRGIRINVGQVPGGPPVVQVASQQEPNRVHFGQYGSATAAAKKGMKYRVSALGGDGKEVAPNTDSNATVVFIPINLPAVPGGADKEFVYSQRTGRLTRDGEEVGQGHLQSGDEKNNVRQMQSNVGPMIPAGLWRIGPAFKHPTKGPTVMRLTPDGHAAHGRDGFLMHGDNKKRDGSASEGCIVLDERCRKMIAESGITRLRVVRE